MKKIILISLFSLSTFAVNAQKWARMMQDPNANFYDIRREFDAYWKDRPYERGKGFKAFKRWAWFVEPRVYPDGNMANASRAKAYEEFQNYLQSNATARNIINAAITSTTSNWTPLGPFGSPVNGDAGRLQCIRFMPGLPTTIFVGTAAGGLWKSTDNGATWSTTTDQLATLGAADLAIDPSNTNIMYLATGDNDAGDTKSIGVLKSVDGGLTWNPTGLSWTTSQQRRIGKLLVNPLNTIEVLAATSVGVYRTLNSGTSWTLVQAGNYTDMEYRPGDTTTVYVAGGASLYKSTNGGASFSPKVYGAIGTIVRIAIAVTPADPNYLYVLGSKPDYSFGGLYLSTNSASTFSTMSTTPNILDWSTNGSGSGGQGWYDLAIDASPTNKNEITIGGVNTWKSANGGSTWTLNTHWYGGGGKPYVHADCHDIVYLNGTTCYAGTDGGIARTTNSSASWTTINGGMNISQQYRLGLSASSQSYIVTGHQDNGTNLLNGTTWSEIYGGDGADCFVDWSLNSTIIASYVNGDYQRSTNSGSTWTSISAGLTGTGAWVAPIIQDPVSSAIFYCGYQDIFRSTNKGTTWTQLSTIGGGDVLHITVAPSNTNVIYMTKAAAVYKTTDGGVTWGNITGSLPIASNQLTGVAVDNTNPNNVYVTMSGYTAGNKVFYSNNGGSVWTNYSTGLPNIPHNCIVFKNNSPGAVYVGTDVGIYYRELSMSTWIPYFNGLPNVIVNDLEIFYPGNKLRAATYGRGTWESDLYSNPSAPPAAFYTTAYNGACISVPFAFTDASSNSPVSWNWSFPGGSPAASASQNPNVTYTATGIYTVSLVATNTVGVSSPYTTTISVVGSPTAVATSTSICAPQNGILTVNTNASLVTWQGGQTGNSATFSPTVTTAYSYTAASGACQVTGTATITVGSPPATPTFTQTGNVLTSSSALNYQWYLNGSPVSGATSQNYTITTSGWYSIWIDNGTGCQASSSSVYITVTNLDEFSVFHAMEVGPNPAKDQLTLVFKSGYAKEISGTIKNAAGQVVRTVKIKPLSGEKSILNLEGIADGVYTLSLASEGSAVNYKFVKQ